MRVEYAITLGLTIAAGIAGYFVPLVLPLAGVFAAMLAHLHHIETKAEQTKVAAQKAAEQVESAVQKAIDAKLSEDWEYIKHRVKQINDHLAGNGFGDTRKRPNSFT